MPSVDPAALADEMRALAIETRESFAGVEALLPYVCAALAITHASRAADGVGLGGQVSADASAAADLAREMRALADEALDRLASGVPDGA